MGVDFGCLIVELEALASGSREDFVGEFWGSYGDYVKTYNKLLNDLQSLGFYKQLKPVEEVSFSEQSFDSGFSKHEKAKLREVVNASEVLLKKVKLLLSPFAPTKLNNKEARSNQIFLVYNKENTIVSDVTQTLQTLDLEPVTTRELTEKTADYPHVSFAVVVLSPDMLAYPKDATPEQAKTCPAQNVVFELGYLLGRLGNYNVAAVYPQKQGFETPKDPNVVWIEYKTGWDVKLVKELKAANFDVNANKLGWL
jgi:predicted nucleotide-binding protein